MNNQHLDFIPETEHLRDLFALIDEKARKKTEPVPDCFDEVSQEDLDNAPDLPEPDYAAMLECIDPEEEGTFGIFEPVLEENPFPGIEGELGDPSTWQEKPEEVKEKKKEKVQPPCDNYYAFANVYHEMEEEFGPMDEDDIPTFLSIYYGEDGIPSDFGRNTPNNDGFVQVTDDDLPF